ncbi:MAG: thioredoxin family protein [Bacteroidales bacterium]
MQLLKNISFAFMLIVLLGRVFGASGPQDGEVNWMSMEEAVENAESEPRMIFVEVYTDWCGFCRQMDNETFSHPVIASYLNDNFYPVKLNAEQEGSIEFRGTVYENNNLEDRRPTHDFAIALLQGRMSYPSIVFFDENVELLTAIPGFRPPASMEAVLYFFNEGVYKETNDLETFIQDFQGQVGD